MASSIAIAVRVLILAVPAVGNKRDYAALPPAARTVCAD